MTVGLLVQAQSQAAICLQSSIYFSKFWLCQIGLQSNDDDDDNDDKLSSETKINGQALEWPKAEM